MSSSSRVKALITESERLLEKRKSLLSLYQEMAENFYPERADFTGRRSEGEEFAAGLTTSFPVKVARDLTNIFTTMLRPRGKPWFRASVSGYDSLDDAGKDYLEFVTNTMRNAFADGVSGFQRATTEGDNDIAVFGQCVVSCEMNWKKQALLWRNWHLKDMAWDDNFEGGIGRVVRRWDNATALELNKLFKGNIHENVKKCLSKEPYKEIKVIHTVVPSEDYDGHGFDTPYVSVFYDVDNNHLLEEKGINNSYYIIPRWKTVAGSQYAYSPATVAGLSDARMLQQMMLVLIEAGQKAVDPPMIAVEEAIRSDVQLFAGGITAVEPEYDERLGAVLRPISQETSGIPLGMEMANNVQGALHTSFFLDKIGLPPLDGGMSPLEVSQRISEYVMNGLPIFEPLEHEYNVPLCGIGFDILQENGAFSAMPIPDSLSGKDIEFLFENPLSDAADKAKGQMYLESKGVIAQAAAEDPALAAILNDEVAIRDVLDGSGIPRKWFKSAEEMEAVREKEAQQEQIQGLLGAMQQGAETAESIGMAGQALQGMGDEQTQ